MTYRLSRRARRDILAIWVYIAENNEPAADRFVDCLAIISSCSGSILSRGEAVRICGPGIAVSQ